MSRFTLTILAGLTLGVWAAPALAQREEMFQRSLFFERDIRQRLEAVTPTEQKTLIEYGGFYSPSYTHFTDQGGNNGDMTLQDFRLWTRISYDEVHTVFARMRMDFQTFSPGDSAGYRQHDLIGPNLEMGYYQLDVSRAVQKSTGQVWPFDLKVRGGREFIEVGRGIALSKILDGASFDVTTKDWAFMGFAARTVGGEDNMDISDPNIANSRRSFYGGQFTYKGIDRHQPYAFFVIQKDWSRELPDLPFQDFTYDSKYFGIGSRGEVATNLQYAVEGIWQSGRSTANLQEGSSEPIRAYALDAELDYYVPRPMRPVLSMEYAYASGDGDRGSATTAINGNRKGTSDREFQGFGYVNSGLALAAQFSNIQFVRLGGRMTPLENKIRFGRIDIGADYYFLMKAAEGGPISDTRATKSATFLGQEVDLYVEWRILSDVSWVLRYGHFIPGNAYPIDSFSRDFLFTGFNFMF